MRYVFILISFFFSITTFAAAADFVIQSTAFSNNEKIPVVYTCDGKDISPPLSWTNPPAGTKSFALIVTDPDAPNPPFFHWVVYNIPANSTALVENINNFPQGTLIGGNSWNKTRYNGPCPPKGTINHHYVFTVYAIGQNLNLDKNADGLAVLQALNNHILGSAELVGIYGR